MSTLFSLTRIYVYVLCTALLPPSPNYYALPSSPLVPPPPPKVWIFTALEQSLAHLTARRQTTKLKLYRRFKQTLMVTAAVATLWAVYVICIVSTNLVKDQWRTQWVIKDGFSDMMYFFVLLSIMVLWRPSGNSRKYAYYSEVNAATTSAADWEDEDGGGGGGGRQRISQYDGDMGSDQEDDFGSLGDGDIELAPAGASLGGGGDEDEDMDAFTIDLPDDKHRV